VIDETLRVDGLTDDEQDIVNRLYGQLVKKNPRNVLRASYYDGKRALHQVGTIIPPNSGRRAVVL
jgi:hypothetical protein